MYGQPHAVLHVVGHRGASTVHEHRCPGFRMDEGVPSLGTVPRRQPPATWKFHVGTARLGPTARGSFPLHSHLCAEQAGPSGSVDAVT